jgi:hypothetical protein
MVYKSKYLSFLLENCIFGKGWYVRNITKQWKWIGLEPFIQNILKNTLWTLNYTRSMYTATWHLFLYKPKLKTCRPPPVSYKLHTKLLTITILLFSFLFHVYSSVGSVGYTEWRPEGEVCSGLECKWLEGFDKFCNDASVMSLSINLINGSVDK